MEYVEESNMEKGKAKCHNIRCGCEFFPRTRVGLKATRCPNCGWTVPLGEDFEFSPQILSEWMRYNIPLQIEGGL